MAIILAEACIDENGQTGYEGTKAGDQTGNEVRNTNYYLYKKGWAHIYRWKDRHLAERFAIRMQGAVKNDLIGYSQPKRYTYWDALKRSDYDPAKIKIACEVDCSALVCANVCAALLEAGIPTRISPMEYTASMEKAFSNDPNFIDVVSQIDLKTGKGLMKGDILLSPPQGHTACVYSVDNVQTYSQTPKWVAEATRYCNVYANATGNWLIAAYPHLGQGNKVDVCDETTNKYYVRIAGKYFGFVEKDDLIPVVTSRRGKVVTDLNVRSGAGASFQKVGLFKAGTIVTITTQAKASDGVTWYYASYGTVKGFVSSKYVTLI